MPLLIMRLQLFGPEFDTDQQGIDAVFKRFDQTRTQRLANLRSL